MFENYKANNIKEEHMIISTSLISFAGLVLLLASCGNSSKNKSEYVPGSYHLTTEIQEEDGKGGYDDYTNGSDDSVPALGNIRLTGRIETCNKCMGYGSVQDGLYSQPQICKFCWVSTNMRVQQGWTGFDGRFGQVDAVFNTLPADFFDELDWNDGGSYDDNNTGGNSIEQIETEIARHERNLAQLEHQLEYIEGSINRTQIEQQIINERYEIKRLKAMINN